MPDLSAIPNPYDFANPVSDAAVFAGRGKELGDIAYYLDYATKSLRPINMALLGGRASGKTSLLNMIELQAREKGLLTARIQLDEGDASSELSFFFKLFDSLLFAACQGGAFGGTSGRTYQTYLDIVYSLQVPEDKTFCPFLFPIQFAKTKSADRTSVYTSDVSVKHDLEVIYREVGHGIALLFDEGNVLAHSRVHLQKLRNIFLNICGHMLVVTGTPELFPLIDDVFSPIIRQFKKITVGTFSDVKDTSECVTKRLQAAGLDPSDLFRDPPRTFSEIHELSGGRPYEIQLICHIMFRRVQEKRASKMALDFGILEEVRRELEVSQDMSARPLLAKIRTLDEGQLRALGTLVPCDGPVSFDESWGLEYLLNGTKYWRKDVLERDLERLRSEGIVNSDGGLVRFSGDDFDKIYTRYFAVEANVRLGFFHLPFDKYAAIDLHTHIYLLPGIESLLTVYQSRFEDDLPKTVGRLAVPDPKDDPLVDSAQLAIQLCLAMIRYRRNDKLPLLNVKAELPWLRANFWYYARFPTDSQTVPNCLQSLQPLKMRAQELGGSLTLDLVDVDVVPVDTLSAALARTGNKAAVRSLMHQVAQDLVRAYSERNDRDESLFLAEFAQRCQEDVPGMDMNNIGYLYLSYGEFDKARACFESAIRERKSDTGLPEYNPGILEAKIGDVGAALTRMRRANEIWARRKEGGIACLFSLRLNDGKLEIVELKDPSPTRLAREALEILERLAAA